MEKITFLEFCNQLSGYKFYNENQVEMYKFILHLKNLTPAAVFKNYHSVLRPLDESKTALA